MPIYEYRCKKCEETFEVIQKVNERPKRRCRSCSGSLEKLVSRSAFHLKGGGWFSEGYGVGPGAPKKGAAGASGSDDSGKKTDSTTGGTSDAGSTASPKKKKKAGSSKKEAASG